MTPMDSSLFKLLLRSSSAAGSALLLIGMGLMVAHLFGFSETVSAAVLSLIGGTALSIAALAGLNYSNLHYLRQNAAVEEQLDLLAQGRLTDIQTPGELFDHLRAVSAYLEKSAAQISSIATGGGTHSFHPPNTDEVLGSAILSLSGRLSAISSDSDTAHSIKAELAELARTADALAAFDLTAVWEARTPDSAAAAASFNDATATLRSRLLAIRDTVTRLSAATSEFEEMSEQLLRSGNAQSTQIERSAGGIAGTARQFAGLQTRITETLAVAGGLENSIAGESKSADEHYTALTDLRKQVQENLRRTKRLGERSQELAQLSRSFEELTERAGLFAMNSALLPSGRNTGTFAAESEQIAERCSKLSRQLSALNNRFVAESKEAASANEDVIRGVIHACSQAEAIAGSTADLRSRSLELSELLDVLASSISFQAKSAHDSAAAMTGIAEVTELIRSGAKRCSASSQQLSRYSAELTAALAAFRLPAERPIVEDRAAPNRSGFVN